MNSFSRMKGVASRRPLTARIFGIAVATSLLSACQGVGRLDLTTIGRGVWQRPEEIVAALDIAPGSTV